MKQRKFLKARFFLTNACPYNCVFCHNEGMGKQTDSHGPPLEIDDYYYLAKILKDNFQLKCITLTGGDPFLYPDIDSLIRRLKTLNIEVVALTRGAPIEKWLSKNSQIFKNLDYVYFSIDTTDPNEFSKICRVNKKLYNKGIRSLKKLVSMGMKVKINCVVDPSWLQQPNKVLKMITFAKKYKINELRFVELVDIDRIKKPFLEKVLRKAGIDIKLPLKPYSQSSLARKEHVLPDGFRFLILRCMCSVSLFTNKVSCLNQDLYLNNYGKVNTCLEWEIDQNPNAVDLASDIRLKKTKNLINKLNNLRTGLHVCPALIDKNTRSKLKAGLSLGTFR